MPASRYLLVTLLVVVQRLWIGYLPCDDAFIAWRFAFNFAQHGALSFNPGDPVFGSTALLYTLVLGLLAAVGAPIPSAAWVVTLLADVAVCLLLTRIASRWYDRPGLGVIASFLWLTHPVIGLNAVSGMETSLFVAMLLGLAMACASGRFGAGAILVALLVWTRIDGAAAAPVLLFAWWRAGRPRLSGKALAGALAIGGAYIAFTLAVYGHLLPQSVTAKLAQTGASWSAVPLLAVTYVVSVAGVLSVWHWYLTPHLLLLAGLARMVSRARSGQIDMDPATPAQGERLLVTLAVVHAAPFILAGRLTAQLYPWYYVPFLSLLLLPALRHLLELAREVAEAPPRWLLPTVVGLAGALALLGLGARTGLALLRDESPDVAGRYLARVLFRNDERFARLISAIEVNTALTVAGLALLVAWLTVGRSPSGKSLAVRASMRAALGALILVPLQLDLHQLAEKYSRREGAYLELGAWASKNLPPSEALGAREIGALGWSAIEHPIYDEVGLVTPEAGETTRETWASRLKPALILEVSTTRFRPTPPDAAPPGYTPRRQGHQLVILREDIVRRWDAAPPPLR